MSTFIAQIAQEMREDHPEGHERHVMWECMATLLEDIDTHATRATVKAKAYKVAMSYREAKEAARPKHCTEASIFTCMQEPGHEGRHDWEPEPGPHYLRIDGEISYLCNQEQGCSGKHTFEEVDHG